MKIVNDKPRIFLQLYVDDMLIASKCKKNLHELKRLLSSEFDMKELGEAKRIPGMEISRDRNKSTLFLHQNSYLVKVLQQFHMHKFKGVLTPIGRHFKLSSSQYPADEMDKGDMENIPYASGIGSLIYGMVCSRPGLSYAMGMVSRFMANSGKVHWEALKWIMRYLHDSSDLGLLYQRQDEPTQPIVGFVDSAYASNLDTKKFVTCFVFTLYGIAIS